MVYLKDYITFINGQQYLNYSKNENKLNKIPIYGTGGIIGYTNNFRLDSPAVLVPRKGSIGNFFYTESKIWNIDTLYAIKTKNNLIEKYFFFWILKNKNLLLNSGTAVPSLTQESYKNLNINVPTIKYQQQIINIIEPFEKLKDKVNRLKIKLETLLNDIWKIKQINSVNLSTLSTWSTGKINANTNDILGKYNFFTCSKNKVLKSKNYVFNGKYIILAGNADIYCKYYNGKFNLYQRVYAVKSNVNDNVGEIYFSINSEIKNIKQTLKGTVIKYITTNQIEQLKIKIVDKETKYLLNLGLEYIQYLKDINKLIK